MNYLVRWGFGDDPEFAREERDIHDAVAVAKANDGVIFSEGQQLSPSEIEDLLHPFRKLAEEIVGTLFYGLNGELGESLEIQGTQGQRVGTWTCQSAVAAVEKALEGSGLA